MGQQKALVIGVSSYPLPITPLPGVANDARAMAELLGSPQGEFRNGEVVVLIDARANGTTIREHLTAVLGGAGRDDTVFVYIAGHGTIDKGAYYFVAHDTILGPRLAATGIPLLFLREMFDNSPSRRLFVWLDFCHSGGIIERSADASMSEENEIIERTLKVVKGAGKIIVAACTAEQTAKEPRHGAVKHGFFTLALLNGLRGNAANAEGEVTASSLYEYVVKRVEAESFDQCPVMIGHMKGSIVLMHHGDRKPTPAGEPVAGTVVGNAMVCESSGAWVMVSDLLLPSESVNQQGDRILIEVRPRSTEENAAIQRLRPRHGRGDPVAFAHGDDALVVRVSEISSRSASGQQIFTITLTPEDVKFGGHGLETSVQDYTAEEIAEKRAGRLLLNDPPVRPKTRSYGVGDFVETYIRGGSGTRYPAERAVIQEVYAAFKTNPSVLLPLARLKLLYAVKASDCVEEVLELRLGPISDGKCHVRFRGRRAKRVSNVEPHVINLEGDCPLE
jgi:Caspase domain